MVYQDRVETNIAAIRAHMKLRMIFIIYVIIFEASIVDAQKEA